MTLDHSKGLENEATFQDDFSLAMMKRDALFEQAKYLNHDENAGLWPFVTASKKRLQSADREGDFINGDEEKLTHKNALVVKGVFYSYTNSPVVEGVLSQEKIPVLVEFATVGKDIAAPGLSIKFVDHNHTWDLLTAGSIANVVPWSTTFSNVLPDPDGFKECAVVRKFQSAANPRALSIAHLGSTSWGDLTVLRVKLYSSLYKKFHGNDPRDLTKIENTILNKQEDKLKINIAGSWLVGTIELEGTPKRNQNLRFQHHFLGKK